MKNENVSGKKREKMLKSFLFFIPFEMRCAPRSGDAFMINAFYKAEKAPIVSCTSAKNLERCRPSATAWWMFIERGSTLLPFSVSNFTQVITGAR